MHVCVCVFFWEQTFFNALANILWYLWEMQARLQTLSKSFTSLMCNYLNQHNLCTFWPWFMLLPNRVRFLLVFFPSIIKLKNLKVTSRKTIPMKFVWILRQEYLIYYFNLLVRCNSSCSAGIHWSFKMYYFIMKIIYENFVWLIVINIHLWWFFNSY